MGGGKRNRTNPMNPKISNKTLTDIRKLKEI
jgi:hypothetical protein